MKKGVFQIVTLAVFVILLSVTLCACSLLGSGSKDKDKDGNVDKKLSGIFPTTETPKWSSASGEIFEYREESDEESGSQKIIVIGLKKKTEKQVVIPDGVNKIDENAFAGCNNIIKSCNIGYRDEYRKSRILRVYGTHRSVRRQERIEYRRRSLRRML